MSKFKQSSSGFILLMTLLLLSVLDLMVLASMQTAHVQIKVVAAWQVQLREPHRVIR